MSSNNTGGAAVKTFSTKDLYNLQLLSHLQRQQEISLEKPNPTNLGEILSAEDEAKRAVRDLTKFLSLFTE